MVPTGTVAVDGEREIEFSPDRPVSVTLSGSGPLVVDIPKVMRIASDRDLLLSGQAPAVAASSSPGSARSTPQPRSTTPTTHLRGDRSAGPSQPPRPEGEP